MKRESEKAGKRESGQDLETPSSRLPVFPSSQERVDLLQYELGKLPQVEMPLLHRFTPGLYTRQITMPAGSVVISRVHKTTHPFVISKGRCSVWSEEHGVQELAAPYCGITTPATRRILVMHEETVWTTFHPTQETDLQKLQEELTETPDVSYIGQMSQQAQALLGFETANEREPTRI